MELKLKKALCLLALVMTLAVWNYGRAEDFNGKVSGSFWKNKDKASKDLPLKILNSVQRGNVENFRIYFTKKYLAFDNGHKCSSDFENLRSWTRTHTRDEKREINYMGSGGWGIIKVFYVGGSFIQMMMVSENKKFKIDNIQIEEKGK